MWIRPGSQHEPVYPGVDEQAGEWRDPLPTDIPSVAGADEPDESRIGLTPIAAKYGGASSPPCSIPARCLL